MCTRNTSIGASTIASPVLPNLCTNNRKGWFWKCSVLWSKIFLLNVNIKTYEGSCCFDTAGITILRLTRGTRGNMSVHSPYNAERHNPHLNNCITFLIIIFYKILVQSVPYWRILPCSKLLLTQRPKSYISGCSLLVTFQSIIMTPSLTRHQIQWLDVTKQIIHVRSLSARVEHTFR